MSGFNGFEYIIWSDSFIELVLPNTAWVFWCQVVFIGKSFLMLLCAREKDFSQFKFCYEISKEIISCGRLSTLYLPSPYNVIPKNVSHGPSRIS